MARPSISVADTVPMAYTGGTIRPSVVAYSTLPYPLPRPSMRPHNPHLHLSLRAPVLAVDTIRSAEKRDARIECSDGCWPFDLAFSPDFGPRPASVGSPPVVTTSCAPHSSPVPDVAWRSWVGSGRSGNPGGLLLLEACLALNEGPERPIPWASV